MVFEIEVQMSFLSLLPCKCKHRLLQPAQTNVFTPYKLCFFLSVHFPKLFQN